MISERVDQTDAGEGDELRLLFAPARQRGGPFAGAVESVDLLAGGNHAAIDDSGDDHRQLA
jgi:hypothetical protein